jgi:hypothetical protein
MFIPKDEQLPNSVNFTGLVPVQEYASTIDVMVSRT